MNSGVNMTALNKLKTVGENRQRAAALQDADAPRRDHHQREASWSAPVLWSLGRVNPAPNLLVKRHRLTVPTSPRPSLLPPGDRSGRNIPRVSANPRLDSGERLLDFTKSTSGCSLSQRERVRVRDDAFASQQPPALIPTGP